MRRSTKISASISFATSAPDRQHRPWRSSSCWSLPSFPAATVPEFITYAKANPGKINMASAGNGTPPHVAGELFKTMTGVDLLHVPYRGVAPAITDLLGGQVHELFDPDALASIGYVRAAKLRALAVTTVRGVRRRYPTYQQLPSSFRGYEGRAPGLALARSEENAARNRQQT